MRGTLADKLDAGLDPELVGISYVLTATRFTNAVLDGLRRIGF